MLRILGSSNPFNRAMGRRTAMAISGLTPFARTAAAGDQSVGAHFGQAKQILLLYLQGAASQFETWDPKPEAPEEIRGPFGAMPTILPGVRICDQLPKMAQRIDQVAVIRSMSHENNNHSNLYTLTGYPAANFTDETNPAVASHHPFFASVLDYLHEKAHPGELADLPYSMGLPWQFSSFSPLFRRAGPYGAFLGHGYDPVWTEFNGQVTKSVTRSELFGIGSREVRDPFLGITPESRVRLTRAAQLREGMTIDRLNRRRTLAKQLDNVSRRFEGALSDSLSRHRAKAWSLLTSGRLQNALDVGQESDRLRESYGMNLFGQSVLTARRLLEVGCPMVSVFWDEYKVVNTAWDTHMNHVTRLRDELLPELDSGLSTLLDDMRDRGMLETTLILLFTEHGRTPKIVTDNRSGGGRDHWSRAYSILMAGAGIRPGTVLGVTDSQAAFVKERPVSPEDVLATIYHLKGIPAETTIPDRLDRPVQLVEHGDVIHEILG